MKKNLTRLISLILVVAMAVFATGCAQNTPTTTPSEDVSGGSEGETTTTTTQVVTTSDPSAKQGSDGTISIPKERYDELVLLEAKYAELEELQDFILKNFNKEVEPELLVEGAKKGIFSILGDPYSQYMTEEEFTRFMESITGEFTGIGVYVTPNPKMGIEVIAPIEDTPAFNAGLKPLDIILAVDGQEFGYDEMDTAVTFIRGEPGTTVTLTIYRPSTDETFDVVVERAVIVIKSVKSEMLTDDIGYVRLTEFGEKTSKEFKEHMDKLMDQGMKGLVLDLRDNPGGSLQTCLEIVDMLVGEEKVLSIAGRGFGTNDEFYSDAWRYNIELAVLVNKGSASASEIVAGAIKDTKSGVLIGTQTFGKGIVQSFLPYGEHNGIKLTTSEYFTPSGANIHGIGIEPDIVLEPSEEFKNADEKTFDIDNQLQEAIKILNEKIK